jgi:hypothetical protein
LHIFNQLDQPWYANDSAYVVEKVRYLVGLTLRQLKPGSAFSRLDVRSGFKTTPETDKPQIRFKSKAQADEKAQSARVHWRMRSTF